MVLKSSSAGRTVTGLAEGVLVDERLSECLIERDWVLLLISLENLDSFRESYGFVASDDVQRAVGLMIYNALRGVGGPNDFLGHLSPTEFILVTGSGNVSALIERIRTRLDQSLDYFYPLKDRDQEGRIDKRLSVWMSQLSAQDGPFSDLDQIKAELMKRRI